MVHPFQQNHDSDIIIRPMSVKIVVLSDFLRVLRELY